MTFGPGAGPAAAQAPTDYLVQEVCLTAHGAVTSRDPAVCGNKRKLLVGEPLPYHKVDMLGAQISDSFPISDLNGISRAVQTYFFTSDLNIDVRFPGLPHFYPFHGGYNIMGADSSYVYFRGTFDQSGGWQPWWTANCQAKGWLLFPNTAAAFSYGGVASPTQRYPACPGVVPTAASTVEWDHYAYTYASGKTLDTLTAFHFAPGYNDAEQNYFTKEYGATRWEAWKVGTGTTPAVIKQQCPGIPYTATLHGKQFYLADCRDWSTIQPLTTFWDPDGSAQTDSYVKTWQVDPLYFGHNLLSNTWIGGPYYNNGPTGCATYNWDRVNTPAVLNWAYDTTVNSPFTSTGNCALKFSTPGPIGGQALFQMVNVPAGGSGTHSFGALLWAPAWQTGQPKPSVKVTAFQRDASGTLLSYKQFEAFQTNLPAYVSDTFELNPATTQLILTLYPQNANAEFEITGAWIAKQP